MAKLELERLLQIINTNREELRKLLGDTTVVPQDYDEQLYHEDVGLNQRLALARTWVQASGEALRQRRGELESIEKNILIDQSEKRLWMLEDGKEVYSMSISLGRPSAATKVGEFEILDKLGTVWSAWDIWLPYWMGIYFAGASENGIHGLPYDNVGNEYWASSIGVNNITYGCVMPSNSDMEKLYNWADVGTPVSIVW